MSEPIQGRTRLVSLLVFEDAEVLDVAGPYEVFSVAGRRHGLAPFAVSLVAEHPGPVALRNGFTVVPHHTLAAAPKADILIVPGGMGTRRELDNAPLLAWLRAVGHDAELVLSICTGALLLGKAGMLDGLDATTHHQSYQLLRELAPKARIKEGERFIDNGRIVVAAGVAAGIDMALHVIERLHGEELAEEAALYMEYHWDRNEEGLKDQGI
jgi:transcriptional regulator GlxA family with amidase domain